MMYKNILGPDETSSDVTMRCTLSIPRSGSTFVHIFLHVYNALLNKQPITDKDLIYDGIDEVIVKDGNVITGHAECPRFRSLAAPENVAKWSALCEAQPLSYLFGDPHEIFRSDFPSSPEFLRSKIVFLFRNPLDQALSSFTYINSAPSSRKIDLETFIRDSHIIDWYIKVFYTFHIVRQHYPDILLFVPYEQLMADKPNTLRRMFVHLGLQFDQAAFSAALELTSMESLKAVELRSGRSLRGGDQGSKHIHSGKCGGWQEHMSLKLVEFIEQRLNQFGLSLKMFNLAEKLESQFAFLEDSTPVAALSTLRLGMS